MPRGRLRCSLRVASCALPLLLATAAAPNGSKLSPRMAPLGFLLGRWTSTNGQAEGRQERGSFSFEPVAGGDALLRRDRSEVLDANGRPTLTVEQVMLIYPEEGHLHADYYAGGRTIHYSEAEIVPGRSVRFATSPHPGAPDFRLFYMLAGPDRVVIQFEMKPPGHDSYKVVAAGAARRSGGRVPS